VWEVHFQLSTCNTNLHNREPKSRPSFLSTIPKTQKRQTENDNMLPKSSESNTEHPDDELRATLQHELMGAFLGRSEYDRASVLTLYWEVDDFEPPCKTEVEIVNELFRNDFRYETETFVIPSENSYNMLELALVDFKCRNDGPNNLLIVYYCGHGDESVDLQRAVWSAYVSLWGFILSKWKKTNCVSSERVRVVRRLTGFASSLRYRRLAQMCSSSWTVVLQH